MDLLNRLDYLISTHTLTWSVTIIHIIRGQLLIISTHTLTWSVTNPRYDITYKHNDFNSHAHVERDVGIYCNNLL